MFNINLAAIPSIPTRKALLIIDLQNDFVSPEAALPVVEPEGFVARTLDLARTFRNSGAGDVIWVRSEFQRHRTLTAEGEQIITSDLPQRPPTTSRMSGSRGRQTSSKAHDGALLEMDDESFLSISQGSDKPVCVRKGTQGAEFPAQVQEAIDSRDIVFTKTHYSAFAQQELVQMLRGRLVTEMYVCGSLTNIGIYATALDAARHGYEMTLVEDCCGFRSEMRHVNAVRQLMELVGSEAINAEAVMDKLQPSRPKAAEISKPTSPKTPSKKDETDKAEPGSGSGSGSGQGRESGASKSEKGTGTGQKSPVRPQSAAPSESQVPSSTSTSASASASASTGLSPSLSKVSLSRSHNSPAATSPSRAQEEHVPATGQVQGQSQGEGTGTKGQVQTVVTDGPSTPAAEATSRPSFWVDHSAPLEADSDPESDTSSPGLDELVGESRYRGSAAAEMRSRMSTMSRGDVHVRPSTSYSPRSGPLTATQRPASSRGSAGSGSPSEPAAPERAPTRVVIRTRRRVRGSSSNTPESSPNKSDKITATAQASSSSSSSSSPSPAIAKQPKSASEPTQPTTTATTPQTAMTEKQPSPTQQLDDETTRPIFTKPICEGDTTIILNTLPPPLASTAFERLLSEVQWAGMSRMGGEVPRRIAVQGEVDSDQNMPVYRHPADESPPLLPFTPTVRAIKDEIEKHLGHPLNHVLIQHYRTGNDYISEHSDKTLDIVRDSFIANVSLGAERTMVFRTKRPSKNATTTPSPSEETKQPPQEVPAAPARQTERAPLPHNSLCRMGLQTNMRWLHAIRQDKRLDKEKSPAELAYNGARISLTFRQIGTFLDKSQTKIWGQGAVSKSQDSPGDVISGQEHPQTVELLKAFGAENNSSEFNWEEKYGKGFNVLHMGSPKRFCAGSDGVINLRVRLALAETPGVGGCAGGSVDGATVRFEDNDPGRAVVDGHENVLRYLDAVYGSGRRYDQMSAAEVARRFGRLQWGLDFLGVWRRARGEVFPDGDGEKKDEERAVLIWKLEKVKEFKAAMVQWEGFAREAVAGGAAGAPATAKITKSSTTPPSDVVGQPEFYIAGGTTPSPADFALWPVLNDIVRSCGEGVFEIGVEQAQGQSAAQSKKLSADSKQKGKSTEEVWETEGSSYLARYYTSFGARSAVRKVVEAESVAAQKQKE